MEDRSIVIIRNELQKLGYQVDYRIGQSDYKIDLAVVHPYGSRRYILAIETNGPSFYSAKSALERDVERQELLESKGWHV